MMRTLSESRIERERQRQDAPHWLTQIGIGALTGAGVVAFFMWALSAPGV